MEVGEGQELRRRRFDAFLEMLPPNDPVFDVLFKVIEKRLLQLRASGIWPRPVVTPLPRT